MSSNPLFHPWTGLGSDVRRPERDRWVSSVYSFKGTLIALASCWMGRLPSFQARRSLSLADGVVDAVDDTLFVVVRAVLDDQIVVVDAIDQGCIFTVAFDVNPITSTRIIVLAALVGGASVPTIRLRVHTSIFAGSRLVHAPSVNGAGRTRKALA